MDKPNIECDEHVETGSHKKIDLDTVAMAGHEVPLDSHGHALLQIESASDARITRKMDVRILPVLFGLYITCFLDRSNIGNARLAGLEKSLGMSGYDFNTVVSIFCIMYILFEVPSNIIGKLIGPGKWLPICTFSFGLISMCTAFVHNDAGLTACRFFLGIPEAGLLPGIVFYLSRWYRKDQLSTRVALVIVSAPISGAFSGLLASAILKIHHIGYLTSWRLIFLLEGLITCVYAVVAYFLLPAGVPTAKWLTEEEKRFCAVRLKAENAGTTTVIEHLNIRAFLQGVVNINSCLIALIFLFVSQIVQVLATFLPTIIAELYPKNTVIQQQLKTVPPYIVGAFTTLLLPILSGQLKNRAMPMLFAGVLMIVGFAMFVASGDPTVGYAACFITIAGAFPFGTFCTSWATINAGTDSARASAVGVVLMGGNIGALVGAWTILPQYKPRYLPAQRFNLASAVIITLLVGVVWAYQVWENRQREAGKRDYRLVGKTPEEAALLGHKHPRFRYRS